MDDEPFMQFEYMFFSPLEVMIEETSQGVALIKGTLLVEGISRNGNLYTVDEMENIAKQAVGKPIFFGVKNGINPNTGLPAKNLHNDEPENKVGKITETFLDPIKRRINFVAQIMNTEKFPDIIKKIKAGWGVSIGGFVTKAKYVLNEAKKLCLKIQDMVVQHVSLVDPTIIRGQDEAKVEDVHIQETMVFDMPKTTIVFVIDSRDVKGGEVVR